jgi:uncharacterized protein YjbI with pentapeptide repeats
MITRRREKEKIQTRRLPNLSADLRELREMSAELVEADEVIDQGRLNGFDFSDRNLPGLSAKFSVFEKVSFAGCEITAPFLQDVRLIRCDLSNATLRKFQATRVEIIECRLMGMKAVECRWQDVLVEDCDGRYAQFTDGRIRPTEFRNSSFVEADFRGVDFEGSTLVQVDLSRADLRRSKLRNTDLRSCEIEAIMVGAEDVRGATVSAPQAMDLARLLGLTIG